MECSIKCVSRALLFFIFVSSVAPNSETPKTIKVKPSEYLLEIKTTPEHFKNAENKNLTFEGKVTIKFEREKSDEALDAFTIRLNAQSKTKVLENDVKLTGLKAGLNDRLDLTTKSSISGDYLVITCTEGAKTVTKFELEVGFENPFGDDMTGFYRSSYKNTAGETIWLLTTHFEPIFARKAFPCFDEPNLKALFEIHITVPKNIKTVLSNTAVNKAKTTLEESTFKFKKTVIPMSTYLVAFTASNLKASEPVTFNSDYNKDNYGVERKLTTYGREEFIKRGDHRIAQNVGKRALTLLTEYLGIGYAFEKVDQVGIPDFSAGAMENWGHVSYREKSLFINSKSSTATQQANVLTITHELVHQWFGNLVTLESWNYIWLNEAFANYLEYIIANMFEQCKKWDLMKQLVVNEIHLRAFETDGLASSKPLNNIITDESLIYSSFNDIPYSKGAAVLRMWHLQMSDEEFKESLSSYIKARKEQTGNPEQLYTAFKNKITTENFYSWTNHSGYPVVELKKINGSYTLTQNRFLWDSSNLTSTYWVIPISYSTNGTKTFDTKPTIWLANASMPFDLKFKWIIVNNQQAGYYRVNYDEENWRALSSVLQRNHSDIHELNRAQLINDAFSLARSLQKEYLHYSTALNLVQYLGHESSFVTLKTALNSFDFLQTKLHDEKNYNKFRQNILSLIKPHFKTLKTDGLEHIEKLKAVEISRWACSLDFDPCVKEAQGIFKNKTDEIYPDTQEIILCTVVRKDNKVWEEVFKKYENETDSALKVMYISALGCTSDEKIIDKFLSKTLADNSGIRKQDKTFVLSSVYNGNLKNVEKAFKFIETNYKEIAKNYGGINPLGKALVGIARKLKTKAQLTRLEDLTKKIAGNAELGAAAESRENALNIARSNVKWVEKRMEQVNNYFNSGSLLSYSFGLLALCLLSVFQF